MSTGEQIKNINNIVVSDSMSVFSLIADSDPISKMVMLLLLIASIWSWAIIVDKILLFRLVKRKIASFDAVFWSGQVLDQLYDKLKRSIDNPMSAILVGGMDECRRIRNVKIALSDGVKIGHKERVYQSMCLIRNREVERLERNLSFLAIVGSNAPFVGLFGTVWGIMHSFQSIAASQNTTLAVVAPGIAEALLATAIGLVVAIPAVIFYNYLSSQINSVTNKIDDFVNELNSILSRAVDEEKM